MIWGFRFWSGWCPKIKIIKNIPVLRHWNLSGAYFESYLNWKNLHNHEQQDDEQLKMIHVASKANWMLAWKDFNRIIQVLVCPDVPHVRPALIYSNKSLKNEKFAKIKNPTWIISPFIRFNSLWLKTEITSRRKKFGVSAQSIVSHYV